MELHFYDPSEPVAVLNRRLPHWSQPGVVTFVTWRTMDSIPAEVLSRWRTERAIWLRQQGIDPQAPDWSTQLRKLDRPLQIQFAATFSERWHDALDACHGNCELGCPEVSGIVDGSLRHFDGDRYELLDYVVMPNHVHVLAAFPDDDRLVKQCDSWKHFTAREINRLLGKSGRFWQQDSFDHLVRSAGQLARLRTYIARNPVVANLGPGRYLHYTKP